MKTPSIKATAMVAVMLTSTVSSVFARPFEQFIQSEQAAQGVHWPKDWPKQWPERKQVDGPDPLMPLLKLDYQSYQAGRYDSKADVYTFKNIRFAAPPVGDLRWRLPVKPAKNDTISYGEYGPSCVQPFVEGALRKPKGSDTTTPANMTADMQMTPPTIGHEDCLFFDMYVPRAALIDPETSKLPVIVWLFGGGYFMGSKDSMSMGTFFLGDKAGQHEMWDYSGTPIIQAANNKAIFLVPNYRLGAFGFLAGTTVERDAVANVGLFDQRAVFQWVQDYIHLVGGDKTQVSAWGESAGGGSIINHLILKGGTLDPLFQKAVIQSGAHPLVWDRHGEIERRFQVFERYAGCEGKGIACLRQQPENTLRLANINADKEAPKMAHYYSPAPDGNYIRQVSPVEFAQGNYWKNLTSLIVSHVQDEAIMFVPNDLHTDDDFMKYLYSLFPPFLRTEAPVQEVLTEYPPITNVTKAMVFGPVVERAKLFVRDSTFTCHDRWLSTAFPDKTWAMQYSVAPAVHATDLLATFERTSLVPVFPGYKSYLASHATTGNPNKLTLEHRRFQTSKIHWPKADHSSENMKNVLDVSLEGFKVIEDNQDTLTKCNFWRDFLINGTAIGGYAMPPPPPGPASFP